jgi:7-cyano-7-deazaguanine synthase
MNALIRAGTRPETELVVKTPLIGYAKRDIIRRGFQLGVPFRLTWSCYRDSEVACGICDSCALRLRAFQEAGVEDPIAYAIKPEYSRT